MCAKIYQKKMTNKNVFTTETASSAATVWPGQARTLTLIASVATQPFASDESSVYCR